jgi:ABC-2 type transport system ATP-binding protein
MPTGKLKEILASLRQALGQEPDVDHPRRNLEEFFLEVVQEARAAHAESAGDQG